jgi:hypothetical protein
LTDKSKLDAQPEFFDLVIPDKTNNTLSVIAHNLKCQKSLIIEKEDSSLLDKEKVQQESKEIEGAHMEIEFDTSVIDQPSMMYEVKKLNEVEKFDTMVLSVNQDKVVSFVALISPIDFVNPNKFNDLVEHKASLFSVLPKVIQKWKQVSRA